jgi:hypothetical protein
VRHGKLMSATKVNVGLKVLRILLKG